ncbi:MAG: hypothetical protein WC919_01075 [Candidatus Paceibacterota bacterium]|jgi:hypothetical protein
MRIKSDFHDYYDCAQAFGQDQELIYIRKKIDFPLATELKTKRAPFPMPDTDRSGGYTRIGELPTGMQFFVIGIAGKVYPCFKLYWHYPNTCEKDVEAYCYSLADIDKIIKAKCNKKTQETFNEATLKKGKRYHRRYYMSARRAEFELFFTEWEREDQAAKVQQLFSQYPIFVIEARRDGWYVCYNCSLKEYKFFKVKDTVTAYQEIAMFLGGLATPQKPIPVPSDKDMVSIKGFDKFSFRKEPTKKKKK